MLSNRSSGRIVRFRLGCVTGAATNKVKVMRRSAPVNVDLGTDNGYAASISVHTGEMERCYKMNAQLAVIEVLFKDGFSWKAK